MAVADRLVIEQATRGVLAALFALNQQAEMGVDEGFGGVEEIDGTGIRDIGYHAGIVAAFSAAQSVSGVGTGTKRQIQPGSG